MPNGSGIPLAGSSPAFPLTTRRCGEILPWPSTISWLHPGWPTSLSFRAVSLRHDTKSQRHRTLLRQRTDGKFFRHAQKREDLPDRGIQATERTGQNDHFSLYFYLLQPRQGLYTQPAWAAACEVPGVGAGAAGSLIRCRRSFPAFRYAPLRKTALYYHAFQILGVSRLHIS